MSQDHTTSCEAYSFTMMTDGYVIFKFNVHTNVGVISDANLWPFAHNVFSGSIFGGSVAQAGDNSKSILVKKTEETTLHT